MWQTAIDKLKDIAPGYNRYELVRALRWNWNPRNLQESVFQAADQLGREREQQVQTVDWDEVGRMMRRMTPRLPEVPTSYQPTPLNLALARLKHLVPGRSLAEYRMALEYFWNPYDLNQSLEAAVEYLA